MSLSEQAIEKIPANALRVIESSIEGFTGEGEMDPDYAERVRHKVYEVISGIAERGRVGSSGVLSLNYLSSAIDGFNGDTVVTEQLHGIAQSIGLLTGQKDGSMHEPAALRPRQPVKGIRRRYSV